MTWGQNDPIDFGQDDPIEEFGKDDQLDQAPSKTIFNKAVDKLSEFAPPDEVQGQMIEKVSQGLTALNTGTTKPSEADQFILDPQAFEEVEGTDPTGRLKTAGGQVVKGAGGIISGLLKSSALTAAADPLGTQEFMREAGKLAPSAKDVPPMETDPREHVLYKAADTFDDFLSENIKTDPKYEQEFWAGKVPHGMGSMLGFMASAFIGRGALSKTAPAAAGAVSVAVPGAAVQAADQFEDALNEGSDLETAYNSAKLGALVGTSEALPIVAMFNRFDKKTGGTLKKTIVDALKEGSEEALQEGFQTVMSNLIAEKMYDPDRKLWAGAEEGAGVGFTTGALTSVLLSMLGMKQRGMAQKPVVEPVEEVLPEDTIKPFLPEEAKKATIKPETDDILSAIAKEGGIGREEAEGIDPEMFGKKGYRSFPVFTKDGKSIDEIGQTLVEHGYPVTKDGKYDPETMRDSLNRALADEPIMAPQAVQKIQPEPEAEVVTGRDKEAQEEVVREPSIEKAAEKPDRRTEVHKDSIERRELKKRKLIEELDLEEAREALRTSELTPLSSKRVYLERKRKKHQASFDLDNFKEINAKYSLVGGDQLITRVGEIMKEETDKAGVDGYHISGDEFIAESDDHKLLKNVSEAVRKRLESAEVTVRHQDGRQLTKKGVKVSYGTGKTRTEAEANLGSDKARRLEAGLRTKRERESDKLVEPPTQRDRDRKREVTEKPVKPEVPAELAEKPTKPKVPDVTEAPISKTTQVLDLNNNPIPSDLMIEMQVDIVDSGETGTAEFNAADLMAELQAKQETYKALRDCL